MRPGTGSGTDFDTFAVMAWPRLRWAAYLLSGDHQLAEDLAQTALVRTYAAWERVRRDDALAYARKVLVNLNIDRLPEEPTAPDGTASSDQRDQLLRLLATLTERERQVVVLRHYFDLTEVAVAGELGIATGTVKSTLSRALEKLRVSALATDELETTKGQP